MTTLWAKKTSLTCPGSACILALLERGLCNEFAVFIVNSYLNFVEVFRSLLTACVRVSCSFLRHGGLIGSCFLRGAIEAVLHGETEVFQFLDGSLDLRIALKDCFDVLLSSLA